MSQAIFTSSTNQIQRTVPCFPGYAMGGIIRTGELELPYLQQQSMDLTHQIEIIANQKEEIKKCKPEDGQRLVNICVLQSLECEETLKKIEKKIKDFQEEKKDSSFVETMLPIDYSHSDHNFYRSDESENMHFIIVRQQSAHAQIKDFVKHLTKMRYLPAIVDLVDQVTVGILSQVKEDQEVCLLGSFITLARVRTIDPIVIRKDAILPPEITNETTASKYSVISESVLGGVFIGFGSHIFKEHRPEANDMKEITSKLTTFSFISQGAIPPTESFNLWETYNNWKKKLTTDIHCGFPIAFKVRALVDILRENGKL